MLAKTSRPLVALENLRRGLGQTKAETVAALMSSKDSCCGIISWMVEGGDDRSSSGWGVIDKKVPNEDPPSFNEAREKVANQGWT
jgi:hypothetical protein